MQSVSYWCCRCIRIYTKNCAEKQKLNCWIALYIGTARHRKAKQTVCVRFRVLQYLGTLDLYGVMCYVVFDDQCSSGAIEGAKYKCHYVFRRRHFIRRCKKRANSPNRWGMKLAFVLSGDVCLLQWMIDTVLIGINRSYLWKDWMKRNNFYWFGT